MSNLTERRQWMLRLRDLAQSWIGRTDGRVIWENVGTLKHPRLVQSVRQNRSDAYADLMFAWGLASLGTADASRELMHNALLLLGTNEANLWLGSAFKYRIDQALARQPHAG